MSTFRVDLSPFQRVALSLGALDRTQMPFALAGALNASAEIGRRTLIEDTWPNHVEVRDPNFLKNALTTKGERATKRRLRVVVYDKLDRAHLRAHEVGGTKTPRGKALAVPGDDIAARRGAGGVPKRLRPRNLPTAGPHGTFVKGDVLYQRTGKYQKATTAAHKRAAKAGEGRAKGRDGRGLKLRYVLKPTVPIRGTVPFHADFERAVRRAFPAQFRLAMRRAMSTALKK